MKQSTVNKIVFILLFILLVVVVVTFSSGCDIIKGKSSQHSDSTHVKKASEKDTASKESGHVSKSSTSNTDEFEWWKKTLEFQRPDTTVNNFYQLPAKIIYEGGKGKSEQTTNNYDSTVLKEMAAHFSNSLDSLNRIVDTISKQKQTETKGIGWIAIIALIVGFNILSKGVSFLGSRYTITKKQVQ